MLGGLSACCTLCARAPFALQRQRTRMHAAAAAAVTAAAAAAA